MIPKIIHYCWFGGKPKPHSFQIYISSWKKFLPDYKIIEWNESNFDINSVPFTSKAYAAGSYAFVSDYVRLYALETVGGIYFDTDVEVLRSFDSLLNLPAFMGYDCTSALCTAVIGTSPHGSFIKECLDYYQSINFDPSKVLPNPKILAMILKDNNFILNGEKAVFNNCLYLFPDEYFSVKDYYNFTFNRTANSFSIHHYQATWFTLPGKIRIFFMNNTGYFGRLLLLVWRKLKKIKK